MEKGRPGPIDVWSPSQSVEGLELRSPGGRHYESVAAPGDSAPDNAGRRSGDRLGQRWL